MNYGTLDASTPRRRLPARSTLGLVGGVALAMAALISLKSGPEMVQEFMALEHKLEFEVSNQYSDKYGKPGLQYPWVKEQGLKIAEPYSQTTLAVTGSFAKEAGASSAVWEVHTEGSTGKATTLQGAEVTVEFKSTGPAKVRLTVGDRTQEHEVVVFYIRREIRHLTTADRRAFLDAAETVFRTPRKEGKQKYGDRFLDIGHFSRQHNELSGNRDCDHMHDGLGFFQSHGAQTFEFELALQSVNPRVTVPYWDYLIDISNYEKAGHISAFFDSVVFGEDFFGAADSSGDIISGRFQQVHMHPSAYGMESPVVNAYGLLRAPWNVNPSPYVSRFNKTYGYLAVGSGGSRRLTSSERIASRGPKGVSRRRGLTDRTSEYGSVDCASWYQAFNEYTTWSEFGTQLEYQPHGPIHTLVGGTMGADYKSFFEVHNMDGDIAEGWVLLAFGIFKDMWRNREMDCPSSCSSDADASSCKCTCRNMDYHTKTEERAKARLRVVGEGLFDGDLFTTDLDGNNASVLVLKVLCNDYDELNPFIGEMLQSSAPMDIAFWPTHPAVDRLLAWKRINGFTDGESWNSTDASTCEGHGENDVLIWKNLWDDNDKFYTNSEIYDATNPNPADGNYKLPYIYDTFRWESCADFGYPTDLVNSTSR